jgi:hypothetical protein
MPEFLTSSNLNARIEAIIENSKENLILISPYIKFSKLIRRKLERLKVEPNLKLTIVFGKNADDYFKSIATEDFEFLKTLPNIEIKYEPDLHAKVYMNDGEIILSSMNLYEYSQANNIEFGVYGSAKNIIGKLSSSFTGGTFDEHAVIYFREVAENSKTLYKKEPQFEGGGMFSSPKYTESVETVNELENSKAINESRKTGYCIRTGIEIAFNPKMPLSENAFKTWEKFADENYPEKYCHFSGEESKGETSFAKPILRKNWKKAMG